jgi:Rrf2 family protein
MITKKTEYAIRALWELANENGHLATANAIAQRQCIPPKYLPQIVSELSRAGLLLSVRGYGGGIKLSRPAKEITVLDVIEAMQGKLWMFECQMGPCDCDFSPGCELKTVYDKARMSLESIFGETRLADIRLIKGRGKSDK